MTTSRLRRAVVTALVATAALPAAGAHASEDQFSVMQDDDILLYRSDDTRDQALTRMKEMDVDVVRATVLWSVVAEDARSTKARDRRFRRLGADDPRAYPKLNWDRYDRLVKAASRLGIRVYFNVTGPGPEWGHRKAPKSQRANRFTWKPKEREFYKFVQAVGKRFSGRYRDENDERGPDRKRLRLPRVSFWSLWNEPNQAGWLSPQWEKGRPASPQLFRTLYDYGYRALVSTGHGGDTILLGETAPLGSSKKTSRAPIAPKTFIRELFCVGEDGLPLQGAEASARKCSFFDRKGSLKASAFGHHPYTKKISPVTKSSDPNAITMANINDLAALLDDIAVKTGRVAPGMKIVSSEFGYETNPPDPFAGVSLETQALWNTLGELLAYQNPRVLAQAQFLLYDVRPRRKNRRGSKAYWSTYQSGLYTAGGNPKPALTAYVMPFLAYPSGAVDPNSGRPIYTLWGALRFRPDGLPPGTDGVQIQWKPADNSADWVPIHTIAVTNIRGYYQDSVVTPGPGRLRAVWSGNQKPFGAISREFPVTS